MEVCRIEVWKSVELKYVELEYRRNILAVVGLCLTLCGYFELHMVLPRRHTLILLVLNPLGDH